MIRFRLSADRSRDTIGDTKPRVYLETTIPSYLTAWPSRDLLRAAHQQVTREWSEQRAAFELFISPFLLIECRAGDPIATAQRLSALDDLAILEQTELVDDLATNLARAVSIPKRATADAFHMAIAAVYGMDYLLTWNCAHIANATLRSRIEATCRAAGLEPPIICTPYELLSSEGES